MDETPAATGAYFCDFLWARLPPPCRYPPPEQATEDGCAPSAEPDVGSAIAVSKFAKQSPDRSRLIIGNARSSAHLTIMNVLLYEAHFDLVHVVVISVLVCAMVAPKHKDR
jgi:hypothetical protein